MADKKLNKSNLVRHLCPADAQALDALLEARAGGQAVLALAGDQAERARQMGELLGVLDALEEGEASAPSVEQTMQAIAAERQRERFQAQVQMLSEGSGSGMDVGWRQVASVAAVVLVAGSLLFPVLERNQAEGERFACMSNLQAAGSAIQRYAEDHQGQMPRGIEPEQVFWNVGQVDAEDEVATIAANSAHLYLLVQQGYVDDRTLGCPSDDGEVSRWSGSEGDWPDPGAVSYSYQSQHGGPIQLQEHPYMAIVADKNPLFITENGQVEYCETTPFTAPSRAHGSRGQSILFADGRVSWQTSPEIDQPGRAERNVIWMTETVRSPSEFDWAAAPSRPDDSFLVP